MYMIRHVCVCVCIYVYIHAYIHMELGVSSSFDSHHSNAARYVP
jgi:hypothetical protein